MSENLKGIGVVLFILAFAAVGFGPFLLKPEWTYNCDGEIVKACNTFASPLKDCKTGKMVERNLPQECEMVSKRILFRW